MPLNPAAPRSIPFPHALARRARPCATLSSEMTPEQLARLSAKENEPAHRSELDVLDNRELELFSILGQGCSRAQIQAEFGFSPAELRALRKRMQVKLGLKSDAQLDRFAREHGPML